MKAAVIFFKLIYIVRKKLTGLKVRYLVSEYQALFPGRIRFPEGFRWYPLPDFYFDQSQSRLVLHNRVAARGHISFVFFNDGEIEIGENTFFNNNCSINCLHKIQIGRDCLFGEGVKLYDHNHMYNADHLLIREQGYSTAPIIIGSNCWIGSNVVILKGVSIGDNCVIGANCIVFKNIPSNSVVVAHAGNQVVKPLLSAKNPFHERNKQ